jgi:hypothetical protein
MVVHVYIEFQLYRRQRKENCSLRLALDKKYETYLENKAKRDGGMAQC